MKKEKVKWGGGLEGKQLLPEEPALGNDGADDKANSLLSWQ